MKNTPKTRCFIMFSTLYIIFLCYNVIYTSTFFFNFVDDFRSKYKFLFVQKVVSSPIDIEKSRKDPVQLMNIIKWSLQTNYKKISLTTERLLKLKWCITPNLKNYVENYILMSGSDISLIIS